MNEWEQKVITWEKNHNEYLGKDTYPLSGISIRETSADELWDYLTKPVEMCKYCGKYRYVKWRQYKKGENDDEWNCLGRH